MDAAKSDDLAATTILINVIGVDNISPENLKNIAEYALNNHNNLILSIIKNRVEEIVLQQESANLTEIDPKTGDNTFNRFDKQINYYF